MITAQNPIPVIAIDGPSASGKGTVARLVAERLGYHYLDSGALYRLLALAASQRDISWQDAAALAGLARQLDVRFENERILLDGKDVSDAVRSEAMSQGASQVAAHPAVRAALLGLQRAFQQPPGLVADGRDMGSVVFPQAETKIFLTASAEVRAERRFKQLAASANRADYERILRDLQARDARDSQRTAAPLLQCETALLLDTSRRTVEETVRFVLDAAAKRAGKIAQ